MNAETKKKIIEVIRDHAKNASREEEKMQALQVLSLFEEADDTNISDLISMVIDGDKRKRVQAVTTLISLGEKVVPEVLERLVGNCDDLDARLNGISILTEVILQEKNKDKQEHEHEKEEDPHEIGPLMRKAFKRVLKEALEEMDKKE